MQLVTQARHGVITALLAVTMGLTHLGYPRTGDAQEDVRPPDVIGFRFTPNRFDVGEQSRTMDVTFEATDDLSGVAWVRADFTSPSKRLNLVAVATSDTNLAARNGTYHATLTIPRYSEFGTWSVTGLAASDRVGNRRQYDVGELKKMGFETEFTIDRSK